MASKFMKIKRIIIPFVTLVIMTSQLAGCATLSSQEMLDSINDAPDVSIEWAVPDTGQQSLDASGTITVGDQQFVTDATQGDNEDSDVTGVIDQQQTEPQELSGDELHNYFQLAYDSGAALEGDLEARIAGELDILVSLVDADEAVKLPADYESQYRAWRPAETVQLFTDVNEIVYATGQVNIRESYTASSTKLGSLSAGQSVTRTGISIQGTKAEGWSRIQLSDGTVAYISNSYISTTKPVQQSTTANPGSQTQQPVSSAPTSGGDTTPGSQSQQNKDGWDQAFYNTLTPEQKAVYESLPNASSRNMMKQDILNIRQQEAEGWITEGGTPTEEELREAWSHIQMGQ